MSQYKIKKDLEDIGLESTDLEEENEDFKIKYEFNNSLTEYLKSLLDEKKIPYPFLIKIWEEFLNDSSKEKSNLLILNLLEDQYKFMILDIIELEKLKIYIEHLDPINNLCESYFKLPQYRKLNEGVEFLYYMSYHIVNIFIGGNIEKTITKILINYYKELNYSNDNIENNINLILSLNLNGSDLSILDHLYQRVCPELVKHCSNIYNNYDEKKTIISKSSLEILTDFFNLFDSTIVEVPIEIINLIKNEVLPYYDSFVSKAIILMKVNMENIFRYMITNHKALKTLEQIIMPQEMETVDQPE
jgi:hypothetical protein